MRRPRAGDERCSCTRAAPGLRPGTLRSSTRSWLTAKPLGLPEARKAKATQKGISLRAARQDETVGQKVRPGADKTLRWSAERHAPSARECPRRKAWRLQDAPLGAPSPRLC